MAQAQQAPTDMAIIGRIPNVDSTALYRIQVGAFKLRQNAEQVYERLNRLSLNPVYEQYLDFTRVIIGGIRAGDIALCLERIRSAGFNEVIIREAPLTGPAAPVSTAALPRGTAHEIGYSVLRVGETKNIAGLATGRRIVSWSSSTPSVIVVDSGGNVSGLAIGNGFVAINETEYISIVVVPSENFYEVPDTQIAMLPPGSKTGDYTTRNLTEYRTEPTFRLAYRFNNRGERKGASGPNGGIDILGRGADYKWLWTSYEQGGWFYDLNGVQRIMVNGYQKDEQSGVELTVRPEFVYDQGVPYLQLRHLLHNPNTYAVRGQKFGASTDVMINDNDHAPLVHTAYGAYMADSPSHPTLELMFIGESGSSITPVDTLWLGEWGLGTHLDYIYTDRRASISGEDSAIGFSYNNIELAAHETREFVIRFTLARTGN
ncbi:MAG: SPOR domain-containing protein [Spirochaetaceae bacterium]|nr:SPOR domain-containing protein [Spirochaetaceae bacterium]